MYETNAANRLDQPVLHVAPLALTSDRLLHTKQYLNYLLAQSKMTLSTHQVMYSLRFVSLCPLCSAAGDMDVSGVALPSSSSLSPFKHSTG